LEDDLNAEGDSAEFSQCPFFLWCRMTDKVPNGLGDLALSIKGQMCHMALYCLLYGGLRVDYFLRPGSGELRSEVPAAQNNNLL
jgi:hypothetical protein